MFCYIIEEWVQFLLYRVQLQIFQTGGKTLSVVMMQHLNELGMNCVFQLSLWPVVSGVFELKGQFIW